MFSSRKKIKSLEDTINMLFDKISKLEMWLDVKEWKEKNKICHIAPYRKDNTYPTSASKLMSYFQKPDYGVEISYVKDGQIKKIPLVVDESIYDAAMENRLSVNKRQRAELAIDIKITWLDRQQKRNRSISCMVDLQADMMSLYQEI